MSDETPVYINIERMKRAMAGPFFTIPSGLSRDARRQYILDCASGKIQPDSVETRSALRVEQPKREEK